MPEDDDLDNALKAAVAEKGAGETWDGHLAGFCVVSWRFHFSMLTIAVCRTLLVF